jgi:hypothetical protein
VESGDPEEKARADRRNSTMTANTVRRSGRKVDLKVLVMAVAAVEITGSMLLSDMELFHEETTWLSIF